jgi:hypothetical protein
MDGEEHGKAKHMRKKFMACRRESREELYGGSEREDRHQVASVVKRQKITSRKLLRNKSKVEIGTGSEVQKKVIV